MNLFNKDSNSKKNNEKPNFWISYADIMAALLLMFILILTVVILDYNTTLTEKTRELNEQKEELDKKEDTIEEIMGLRRDIITALQNEFADTDLELRIDSQTGAIRFPGGVFFATDSTEISEEGQEYLSEFIPQYVDILLGDEFREYISQIIIEGHTDDIGSYMYNLNLSQDRAFSVVKTVYSDEFPDFNKKENLLYYLTANGRSYSQPVLDEANNIDRDRSRRVEFKFRLKDEEMIEELKQTLEG